MAWLFVIVFAAVAFAALWRFGRLPRTGLELGAAAMLIGVAGYAWQGSPSEAGHPVVSRERANAVDPSVVASRRRMMGEFGTESQWLDFADTLTRFGQTEDAVSALKNGIRQNPNSADLWVGLGNALVAHGDGLVSPAATFAFEHAAVLSPEHPGPPFFLGLALAQSGRTADAGQVWRGLLARTPKEAPWRADLESRLTAIGESPTAPAKP